MRVEEGSEIRAGAGSNKWGENGERDERTGGICEVENRASRGEDMGRLMHRKLSKSTKSECRFWTWTSLG